MLNKVTKRLGVKIEITNQLAQTLGYTHGQVRLFKSNARVKYQGNISEIGVINNDTYIFTGEGHSQIKEGNLILYKNDVFLIIKSDTATYKGVSLTWAALKKLEREE